MKPLSLAPRAGSGREAGFGNNIPPRIDVRPGGVPAPAGGHAGTPRGATGEGKKLQTPRGRGRWPPHPRTPGARPSRLPARRQGAGARLRAPVVGRRVEAPRKPQLLAFWARSGREASFGIKHDGPWAGGGQVDTMSENHRADVPGLPGLGNPAKGFH